MSNDFNAAGYELKPWWPYVRELMSNQVTVESVTILENGVYTAPAGKAYSPVTVNVPQTQLSSLTVTENGTYTPEAGSAYNSVTVNVAGGAVETADVTFINTGTDGDLYNINALPHVVNNELVADSVSPGASGVNEVVLTIPLYDGKAFIPFAVISDYDYTIPPVVTGDILNDDESDVQAMVVTGDGSISFKGTGR